MTASILLGWAFGLGIGASAAVAVILAIRTRKYLETSMRGQLTLAGGGFAYVAAMLICVYLALPQVVAVEPIWLNLGIGAVIGAAAIELALRLGRSGSVTVNVGEERVVLRHRPALAGEGPQLPA